jgi:carboxypeptidase D
MRAFTTVEGFKKLSRQAYPTTLVYHPGEDSSDFESLSEYRHRRKLQGPCETGYRDHDQVVEALTRVSTRCSSISQLFSIGKSKEGRDLFVLEMSDNPGTDESGEVEVRIVGNMHGDEVVGRELLVRLAEDICARYYTDAAIKQMVDTTRIFLMPTLNPDGFATGRRNNLGSVDLNRNFPDKFIGDENSIEGREPETSALMQWTARRRFTLAANLHGGAVVTSYPWDGRPLGLRAAYSATPDDDMFKQVALAYSQAHKTMSTHSTVIQAEQGIINGAKW